MNNLLVIPLLIPLCTAALLVFVKNNIPAQRWLSAISMIGTTAVAAAIVYQVRAEGIQTLHMGGWLPPYGIVFTADLFAALLVLAASAVAFFCLLYSFGSVGEQRERYYYYPFFQFLLVGVNGSFLTGDLFNLFVCFEVMLISSYALIVLGGTKRQLRETLKYILVNILSSTLFVASVAYLYGVTGTLNMADLSQRVAEAGQGGILNVIAVLFMIVFSLKAGLFLFFWLPGSYSVPPAAVAALFGALLTKVGLYALIRTFMLIFYHNPDSTHTWIAWMAAATMILGALGAIAYTDVQKILNYNVIITVGFIAFGLAVANEASMDGVVFYLLHDMAAKALLFFLGGMVVRLTGTNSLTEMGGLIKRYPLLGWMLFVTSLAIAGIPPLSGFAGKLLILLGGIEEESFWLTGTALASSFIVLYSLIRMFMGAFWGEEKPLRSNSTSGSAKASLPATLMLPAAGLFIIVLAIGLGSEWVYRLAAEAGHTLMNPAIYIDAVLKE
ncbi:Na+/H+ antiporter subunit D [Paenibacillus sp. N4]|uniref:Na+/H+ antiporter subunit D n=1 Tax=Paenibacillus vietnamensis TaxID=2590547 RepID=UPI001CD10ABB|nr:Na+/H+ antiporter subunit D [Paenibacillus vietnamensis]MCA0756353.1 Na+/H+ antiporter subunit D [Paenibacillus vietnamensis]